MNRFLASIATVMLAAACGGGGGGGDGDGGSGWLTFTPSTISATVAQGEPAYVSLTGTARSVPTGVHQLNIGVVVDGAAFLVASPPEYDGDMSYTLVLQTISSLPLGPHDGYIEVRVCEDDPNTCARPYRDSPWRVPYHVLVVAAAPAR